MKRIWIRAGETVHVEGIPFRVAEDAAMDCNPNNLKLLENVRWTEESPKSSARPEGGFSSHWRDTKVTVPCDGDVVIGYWLPESNFGKRHVGEVHYAFKHWHAVGEPSHKCGVPDYWMPLTTPQIQPLEDK